MYILHSLSLLCGCIAIPCALACFALSYQAALNTCHKVTFQNVSLISFTRIVMQVTHRLNCETNRLDGTCIYSGLCFVSGSQTKVRMYHYIQNVSSLHVLNK